MKNKKIKIPLILAVVNFAFLASLLWLRDFLWFLGIFDPLFWLFVPVLPLVLLFLWALYPVEDFLAELLGCEREGSLFVISEGPVRCEALKAKIFFNLYQAVSYVLLFGLLYLFWWVVLKILGWVGGKIRRRKGK